MTLHPWLHAAATSGRRNSVFAAFAVRDAVAANSRAPRRAFSLVELLVVIGIITILISMLFPAIRKARRQANSTVCKSNLRQCGMALVAYANENHGRMFPVGLGTNVPREQRWPVVVFKPAQWNPPVMLCPDDVDPKEEHSYLLNKHLADKGVRFGVTRGLPSSEIALMGEKMSSASDYYLELISDDDDASQSGGGTRESEFAGIVELYRHGTTLGSNYLYLDLHVDAVAPTQARAAIDPWDVPVPATAPAAPTEDDH